MNNPSIQLIGIYRVPYSDELLKKALEVKYEGVKIPFWNRSKIINELKEELSSIVLIEVLVNNPDDRFDVNDFTQPNSDQSPYDEVYLDENGENIIEEISIFENVNKIRMAFYLHYFNKSEPIKSSYGNLDNKEITEMPERLNKIIKYEPID